MEVKVGTVLERDESIYLVKEVKEDGAVAAQLCGGTPKGFSPIPGVTMYLSKDSVNECTKLGEAEEV